MRLTYISSSYGANSINKFIMSHTVLFVESLVLSQSLGRNLKEAKEGFTSDKDSDQKISK